MLGYGCVKGPLATSVSFRTFAAMMVFSESAKMMLNSLNVITWQCRHTNHAGLNIITLLGSILMLCSFSLQNASRAGAGGTLKHSTWCSSSSRLHGLEWCWCIRDKPSAAAQWPIWYFPHACPSAHRIAPYQPSPKCAHLTWVHCLSHSLQYEVGRNKVSRHEMHIQVGMSVCVSVLRSGEIMMSEMMSLDHIYQTATKRIPKNVNCWAI